MKLQRWSLTDERGVDLYFSRYVVDEHPPVTDAEMLAPVYALGTKHPGGFRTRGSIHATALPETQVADDATMYDPVTRRHRPIAEMFFLLDGVYVPRVKPAVVR